MVGVGGVTKQVERVEELSDQDLADLCESTVAAVLDGGGFGWLEPPPSDRLEAYWRGVLLVPERELFVARLEGTVCGSAQLVFAPRNNEAQKYSAAIQSSFIAPWARGHGLAFDLMAAVEARARNRRMAVLNLDVRETQTAAIELYRRLGYVHWATHPLYAWVRGRFIPGQFFYKDLSVTEQPTEDPRKRP